MNNQKSSPYYTKAIDFGETHCPRWAGNFKRHRQQYIHQLYIAPSGLSLKLIQAILWGSQNLPTRIFWKTWVQSILQHGFANMTTIGLIQVLESSCRVEGLRPTVQGLSQCKRWVKVAQWAGGQTQTQQTILCVASSFSLFISSPSKHVQRHSNGNQ